MSKNGNSPGGVYDLGSVKSGDVVNITYSYTPIIDPSGPPVVKFYKVSGVNFAEYSPKILVSRQDKSFISVMFNESGQFYVGFNQATQD